MTDKLELAPCPHCGAPGEMFHDDGGDYGPESWRVECGASGCCEWEKTREAAVVSWNRRCIPVPAVADALKVLHPTALELIELEYGRKVIGAEHSGWVQAAERVINKLVAENESLNKQIEETWKPESSRQWDKLAALQAEVKRLEQRDDMICDDVNEHLAMVDALVYPLRPHSDGRARDGAGRIVCPTFYDGCNCKADHTQTEYLELKAWIAINAKAYAINLKACSDRAEAAEQELKQLRGTYISMQEELARREDDLYTYKLQQDNVLVNIREMQELIAAKDVEINVLKKSVMVRDSALEIERKIATNLQGTIEALKADLADLPSEKALCEAHKLWTSTSPLSSAWASERTDRFIEKFLEPLALMLFSPRVRSQISDKQVDKDCICRPNWIKLVAECEPLIGRSYRCERTGKKYIFFGLVHTEEDYYYGMVTRKGKMVLLSCVGDFETHGFYPVQEEYC